MSSEVFRKKVIPLKLMAKDYDAVYERIKNFEVRYNDRDYHVGDWLVLCEWDGSKFTNRATIRRITYISSLDELGLNGYVAMELE